MFNSRACKVWTCNDGTWSTRAREAREHIEHGAREAQRHEYYEAREHVGHKAREAREHAEHETRDARDTWRTRVRRSQGMWSTKAHNLADSLSNSHFINRCRYDGSLNSLLASLAWRKLDWSSFSINILHYLSFLDIKEYEYNLLWKTKKCRRLKKLH